MNAITSKGQVTIPKPIRDRLGLQPGSRVDFVLDESGQIILRKAEDDAPRSARSSRISRVVGTLKAGMTTDEIMALVRGED